MSKEIEKMVHTCTKGSKKNRESGPCMECVYQSRFIASLGFSPTSHQKKEVEKCLSISRNNGI